MTKKGKIIWTTVFVMIFAILLVLIVTPLLYYIHPWIIFRDNSSDSIATTPPASTAFFSDTIIVNKDTVVNHRQVEMSHTADVNLSAASDEPTLGDLGTFGDSAGFFNAVFSAMALAAVIYTLFIQIKKDDKDEERNLLNQFRDHCFTLMAMLSEIVSQLKITIGNNQDISLQYAASIPGGIYGNNEPQSSPSSTQSASAQPKLEITGRACFKFVYDEYPEGRNLKEWIANNVGPHQDAVMTEDNYRSLRKVMGDTFDHYFRTLYRILLFIKESDMAGVDKKKSSDIREHCADMLRAQLSTYEMALLYYNGLYPDFRNTSKALFEEFCIFDNLDPLILCLKSETDYYTGCKNACKNGADYKAEIHYDFKAFYKHKENIASKTEKSNASTPEDSGDIGKKKCFSVTWLKPKRKQNQEDIVNVIERFSDDEKNIYEYIKKNQGKSLTKSKIAKDCRLSKGFVGKILDDLEDIHRVIKSKASTNGKKYHLT